MSLSVPSLPKGPVTAGSSSCTLIPVSFAITSAADDEYWGSAKSIGTFEPFVLASFMRATKSASSRALGSVPGSRSTTATVLRPNSLEKYGKASWKVITLLPFSPSSSECMVSESSCIFSA